MSQPVFNHHTGRWEFPSNGPPHPSVRPTGHTHGAPMYPSGASTAPPAPRADDDRIASVRQHLRPEQPPQQPPAPNERPGRTPHNPQPVRPAQPASEPAKPKRGRWIAGVVGAFLLGLVIPTGADTSDTADVTASNLAPASIPTASPAAPMPRVDPPARRPEPSSYSAGTYEVGAEIAPGSYRTTGPSGSMPCYSARLKDADGAFDSIIANNIVQGVGKLTVKKSDGYVELSGSCEWTKAG